MPKHGFIVGMRVRAAHDIIEADYHKGDRTLVRRGEGGCIAKISDFDGRRTIHVNFDRRLKNHHPAVLCGEWDIEPASALDQFAAEVFKPEK